MTPFDNFFAAAYEIVDAIKSSGKNFIAVVYDKSAGHLCVMKRRELQESDIANPNGDIILHYGKPSTRLDITINPTTNNWVETIVAVDPNIKTPRGVAPSSKVDVVTSFYGSGYKKSQYEDLDLYEYDVQSKSGQPYILRFAVKRADDRVDYISIRRR